MKRQRSSFGRDRPAVLRPGHPGANSNGYILESRAVMEDMIGRLLEQGEHVHHRNGNPSDNRPENLELLSPAAHLQRHGRPPTIEARPTKLGSLVRASRRAAGVGLNELAAAAGVAASWLSTVERGLAKHRDLDELTPEHADRLLATIERISTEQDS